MRNDLTGRWGEETAAAYLRRRHYTIVAAVSYTHLTLPTTERV